MRDLDAPMTRGEFREALALAKVGGVMSDTGANDEVLDALIAIADTAPRPPARLVTAAVEAFERFTTL